MKPTSLHRALVIGDVHGCLSELNTMLRAHHEGRQVIFVGDLVAKGPDSKGVLRRAKEIGAWAVRGNHEEHLLRARSGGSDVRQEHAAVAKQLEEQDWDYITSMPYLLELPTFGAAVVHAGAVPGVALEKQSPRDLVSMRSITESGKASKAMDDGHPWASLWTGPELLIFGHDAMRGLQEYPYAIGLDTGCVYGKTLSALKLPEREVVHVPAEQVWCDPNEAPRVRVCTEGELKPGTPQIVHLKKASSGMPRAAIVLRDEQGCAHAYLNICRHLPVPLDAAGRVLHESEKFLICRTHGAAYRLEDGFCFEGPCEGLSLERLDLRLVDGAYYLFES